eukprot:351938-Chlamydomonas_euryale.AAC.4
MWLDRGGGAAPIPAGPKQRAHGHSSHRVAEPPGAPPPPRPDQSPPLPRRPRSRHARSSTGRSHRRSQHREHVAVAPETLNSHRQHCPIPTMSPHTPARDCRTVPRTDCSSRQGQLASCRVTPPPDDGSCAQPPPPPPTPSLPSPMSWQC